MRNLKVLKYSALTLISSAFFSMNSCSIDVIPQDRYVEESIWSDPSTIELYINGMYAEVKKFQFGVFPGLGYDNAMDALADGMKFTSNTPGNGTVNILISNANQFSPASVGLNYWSSAYERIRRVNEFIGGLKTKSQLSADDQVKYEAEARFIRAYTYFWLAKLHGSVIIFNDIAQYSTKDNPRSSEEAVYDFMIEDLDFAATNLPKSNKDGRAGKGAAYALQSRVALFAGSIAKNDKKQFNTDPLTGISQAKANAYFTKSAEAAQATIDLGLYELDADFQSIFTNKKTKEAILRVDFVAPTVTHQYDLGYAPPKDALGNALVYGVPTAELVNEFEMKDGSTFSWNNPDHAADPYANREPRFYASILYNGASWKGRTINTSIADVNEGFIQFGTQGDPKRTVTGYYAKKMLDPTNTNFVVNKSSQSWIELRYAEVYLNLAEAKAQLGEFAAASTALSTLRAKRSLPAASLPNLAKAMEVIEHERTVELAFEGHRFWDLRRWRKAHIELNGKRMTGHKITPEGTGFKYEVMPADASDRSFTGKLYYLPIPELEVQVNLGLTQIQGW
ncbi:RagB/SusD family nutrient uptake outer membrane protein [Sphingobacterium sp. DK4209]|uniref:RagB/SusD family nutrient uptake outer membrane protein n=1 Tax=Sphingobacterium zhuxiongii TaxID=2662364 RepID=A0A5Q0QGJ7_9SPHI|nr:MULTISPECIES: RagB/SusD family nutrient uptake outer membrane protein [unclassified Sphingobacterium]MVZ64724.1 RagB/SusD family nutrient uptake outer membrane protein [Sphingobacterium sp. DK4209]QGA27058.1 RagB/SusD family nutrient uptake outer membrane protein [Sphingobacterium sp. dk4302]